ncbi:MAG TPA: hypothetical protein VE130_02805 [Nitrososphaeraceae archaeon]|jgi:hypothetical protein|nr:hypothetical protein [Nitrososphaeraceae archaeon]
MTSIALVASISAENARATLIPTQKLPLLDLDAKEAEEAGNAI